MSEHTPERESANAPAPPAGLTLTFATLAKSGSAGAREKVFSSLESPDPRVQAAAAGAILRYLRAEGTPELICAFPKLSPGVADGVLRRIDDFAHVLREMVASGPVDAKLSVIEMVRRSGRAKLAYLLVDALSDPDRRVAESALEGLGRIAEGVRRGSRGAGEGGSELTRAEIEARRFALLDPILAHLRDLSRPQPDGLLLLAMGLDPRANDLLFSIMDSRQDPRSERIQSLARNAASPHVVAFLYDALRDLRASAFAAEVFQTRRDLPFVRAMLAGDRFLADSRVRESMRLIRSIDTLAGPDGGPRAEVFGNGLLALRAAHFIALTGAAAMAKIALLDAVAAAEFPPFVRTLAETTASALRQGRPPREISAALAYLEGEIGRRAAQGAQTSGDEALPLELEFPWAHPDSGSLPADAFTQFFNAFDRLDDATKRLAAESLRRLDPTHLDRLRQELAGLDAGRRLRAVKALVALHGEEALEGALLTLASDPDRHVRATVMKSLGILEDAPAARVLLSAVDDRDRRVVANTVEAIEQTGRDEFAGLVRILAGHPNNRIRANAIKALWTMGARDAASRLEAMLADPDEMMRLSATWVLGEVDHPQRIELLRSVAASDPSERVRAKAKSILGEGAG